MAAVNEAPVVCDTLSAMMDEFEEGTLLSLLEDRELFGYLQNLPMAPSGDEYEAEGDLDLSELFGDDALLPDFLSSRQSENEPLVNNSSTASLDTTASDSILCEVKEPASPAPSGGSESDISNNDSTDSDVAEDTLPLATRPAKRRKVERDKVFLTSCVEHDHCYTLVSSPPQTVMSPGASPTKKEVPTEEDTGYETMSSSTSPGTAGPSSNRPGSRPFLPPPALPQLSTPHINPVTLIDARIKHFMQSQQVCLTEEEKETLRAEGLPIPTTLPLTKVEEKALKSVRRKIRNKVAAQESRKRKKEHMQELEEKVRQCTTENLRLQKKVENLELENRSLLSQLKRFQALVAGSGNTRHTTKVGACLMVFVLCFAVLLGGWIPQKHLYWTAVSSDYSTASVRSRSLLSVEPAVDCPTFPRAVCDWFRYTFFPDRSTDHYQPHSSAHHSSRPDHAWPDVFLSSHTPLTAHQHHNATQNNTPAIAA